MGCFSPDAPPPVNYGQQTRDTLQAQVDLAPQLYASEAQYQPQYANLDLSNLSTILNGAPAGTSNYTTTSKAGQTGWYDNQSGQFINPGQLNTNPGAEYGGALTGTGSYVPGTAPNANAVWAKNGSTFNVNHTQATPAQPGLFSLLQQQNTNQRASDINDVTNLGPSATAAMLNANPNNAQLLSKLNAQANTGLDAGSSLTADEAQQMQQQSRAAFAARGMGGSNQGVSDELLKQFNLGQQLQTQRQQFAESVIGQNQAVVGDPFQQILGRNSGAVPMGQGMQPGNIFNPESNLSSSITAGNQQMNAMFATSTAQEAGNAIAPMNSAVASY